MRGTSIITLLTRPLQYHRPWRLLLPLGALLVSAVLGRLIAENRLILVSQLMLAPSLLVIGLRWWRWLILIVYPLVWNWTWYDISIAPGLSVERLLAIPALLGLGLELSLKRRRLRKLPFRANAALGTFVAALFVSFLVDPGPEAQSRLLSLLQKVVWAYLVFAVLTESGEHGLRRFTHLLIASTTAGCIGTLILFVEFGPQRIDQYLPGPPLLMAGAFGLGSALFSSALVFAERALSTSRSRRPWLLVLLVFILAVPLLASVRRELLFTVPLVLLAVALVGPSQERKAALTLLAIGIIGFFYLVLPNYPVWQQRFEYELKGRTLNDYDLRYNQMRLGLRLAQERPLLGHGLGSAAREIMRIADPLGLLVPEAPHNSFVAMLVDGGIVGLLASLGLWFTLGYGCWRARQRSPGGYLGHLIEILPALLVYTLGTWTFGDAARTNISWTMFGFMWAAIWLAERQEVTTSVGNTSSSSPLASTRNANMQST